MNGCEPYQFTKPTDIVSHITLNPAEPYASQKNLITLQRLRARRKYLTRFFMRAITLFSTQLNLRAIEK